MADLPEMIYIRESLARTVANDALDCGCLLGCSAVGVWLDSTSLQWVAGLMFILVVFDRSMRTYKKQRRTPQQAADWLAAEYDVRAKP